MKNYRQKVSKISSYKLSNCNLIFPTVLVITSFKHSFPNEWCLISTEKINIIYRKKSIAFCSFNDIASNERQKNDEKREKNMETKKEQRMRTMKKFSLLMLEYIDTESRKVNPNKRRPDGDSTIIERAAKATVQKICQKAGTTWT